MGSAVVKPLTRKRGKIKKNQIAVVTTHDNKENNAISNCEPIVSCKVNPLFGSVKNLHQPFFSKRLKVDIDNPQPSHSLCCTYVFSNRRRNSLNSDEVNCQKQLARLKNMSPSQTKNSFYKKAHPSENGKIIRLPSHAPMHQDLLSPSLGTQPDKCKNVSPAPGAATTVPCTQCPPAHNLIGTENQLEVKRLAGPGYTHDSEITQEYRTPSPQHDDLDDVQVINPDRSPTELCSVPSLLNDFGHYANVDISSAASGVGVSASSTDKAATEGTREDMLEKCHVSFLKMSSSTEHIGNAHYGGGEPLSIQINCTPVVHFQQDIKHAFEIECEDLDSENSFDGTNDHKCVHVCKRSPIAERDTSVKVINVTAREAQADMSLECNENNAIHSTDIFGEVIKKSLEFCGSNHSLSSSINDKVSQSNTGSSSLLLNNPLVEEVLALGEDYVDGISDGILRQSNVRSPQLDYVKCLTPIREIDGRDYIKSPHMETGKCLTLIRQVSGRSTPNSPRLEAGKSLTPIREIEGIDHIQTLTLKTDDYLCRKEIVESSHCSLCSSKTSDINLVSRRPRSESDAETSVRLSDTLLAYSNNNKTKSFARFSAANELQSPNYNEVLSSYRSSNSGHAIVKGNSKYVPSSLNDIMPKDVTMGYSSNESLQSMAAIRSQSTSTTYKHKQPSTSRMSTVRAASVVATVNVASNTFSSRPPSSKQSVLSTTSEQNQELSRPCSGKHSTSRTDSMQLNARPQSVHSKQSLTTSRPSIGKRLQHNLDIAGEDEDAGTKGTLVFTSGQSGNDNIDGTAFSGGGENPLHIKQLESVDSKSLQTSTIPVALSSTTELTTHSPLNTGSSIESINHWKTETFLEARECVSSLNPCCLTDITSKSNQAKQSPSRSSKSSIIGVNGEHKQPSQKSLATPRETGSPSELFRPSSVNCTNTEVNGRFTRAHNEQRPSEQAASSVAMVTQPCCLSQDKIGNIRKQLYEEGLKPAEREGGVAFFIPVTEDGLLPQIDGAVVAERLTKTKKASLNYEERMFLANINRQIQLSKKKEFAIRDIRNVKGATSSSDGSDRTKPNDDMDEFETPF